MSVAVICHDGCTTLLIIARGPSLAQESQALNELFFYVRAGDVDRCKQIVKDEQIKCVSPLPPLLPAKDICAPAAEEPSVSLRRSHSLPRVSQRLRSESSGASPSTLYPSVCSLLSKLTADYNGLTPLHIAAQFDSSDVLEWLIREGVEVRLVLFRFFALLHGSLGSDRPPAIQRRVRLSRHRRTSAAYPYLILP